MRPLCLLLLVVLPATAGCADEAAPSQTSYDVRGRVAGFAFDKQAVVIDHERISGYMDAMRMTLRPHAPAALENLAAGDKITFRLVVPESGSPYIDRIERLPDDAALELATDTSATFPARDTSRTQQ